MQNVGKKTDGNKKKSKDDGKVQQNLAAMIMSNTSERNNRKISVKHVEFAKRNEKNFRKNALG
jgi:hypothetical protein